MYEIFKKLCDENGITPYRFCKETGVNSSTISTWKNKNSTCSGKLASIIAAYFHVSVDYVYTGKEDQSNVPEIKDPDLKEEYLNLEKLLLSGKQKPLYFDGKPADKESIELLLQQVRISIALLEKSKE